MPLLFWEMFTKRTLDVHFMGALLLSVNCPLPPPTPPTPWQHRQTNRKQLLPGKQPEGLWQSASEVRKEKNVKGDASLWWWNLIRLWRDKKGYFQLLKVKMCTYVLLCAFPCVCFCVRVCAIGPICANPAGYLRLSLGTGRLTHRMTDKLRSPGNPAISFSHRPLLLAPPTPTPPFSHPSIISALPSPPTPVLSLGIKRLHMDCHIIPLCHWD